LSRILTEHLISPSEIIQVCDRNTKMGPGAHHFTTVRNISQYIAIQKSLAS